MKARLASRANLFVYWAGFPRTRLCRLMCGRPMAFRDTLKNFGLRPVFGRLPPQVTGLKLSVVR